MKADTAAMRVELEAIAEEARNNAWKDAILKVANVGITIAGVAAGTALGNPVAGISRRSSSRWSCGARRSGVISL